MTRLPQRKSPRLADYDYSANGAYFVTICTHQRMHLFGEVRNGAMRLSPMGRIAHQQLAAVSGYWKCRVQVDCFVVMPNHVHAILVMTSEPTPSEPTPEETTSQNPTLGHVINAYKGGTTRQIRQLCPITSPVWQSRYHDHIIRNEKGLNDIRVYIETNPAQWAEDRFYS